MSIIDSKERTSGPVGGLFELRLNDIENYGNPIFIVISYYPLVSVRSIRYNNSISFTSKFGRLVGLTEDECGIYVYLLFKV